MTVYTLVQLGEVALFAGLLLAGLLVRSPSTALFAGALLVGKAVLNILAPEGGTVPRRSLIGYALGGAFLLVGLVAVRLAP